MTTTIKPRLTPHQREVLDRYTRRYLRTGRPVSVAHLGSRGAVAHLVEKGRLTVEDRPGPRGGEHLYVTPVLVEQATQNFLGVAR